MMQKNGRRIYLFRLWTAFIALSIAAGVSAQSPVQGTPEKHYKVEGGILRETAASPLPDTLVRKDSALKAVQTPLPEAVDTTALKKQKHSKREADTTTVRYSRLFRDTLPISRVMALSLPLPGFAQLYNKQAWKLPFFYGTTGTLLYFGIQQNKEYSQLKGQVEAMKASQTSQSVIDPVQREMIVKNATRSLLFAGAVVSYMYFMGDGVLNYKGQATNAKRATTLSMICPGAGQIYNKSYWKSPIIVGAFVTMAYVIDFNSRGYNRYKTAYDLRTDGDPNTHDEFEDYPYVTEDYLKTLKTNYRRNRDLCIILTAGLYLLNVVDAHVDAVLKNYDITDDLAMSVEPTLIPFYTRNHTSSQGMGLSLKFRF